MSEILTDMLHEEGCNGLMQLGLFRACSSPVTTEHAQPRPLEEEIQMEELDCPIYPGQGQARSVFSEPNPTCHEPIQPRLADLFSQSPHVYKQ